MSEPGHERKYKVGKNALSTEITLYFKVICIMPLIHERHELDMKTDPTFLAVKPYRKPKPGCMRCVLLGNMDHCLRGSVFAKMMRVLGIEVSGDPSGACCIAIKWAPWSEYNVQADDRRRVGLRHIVNDTHFSCLKSNVSRVFLEVFGYSLEVPPLTHQGSCVMKAERNAQHDGQVIQCPVKALKPGMVYQKLINNSVAGGFVEDIRVPIIGNRIPFAYLKYRPRETRFSNQNSRVELRETRQILTDIEMNLALLFARRMGLDYGELDMLRDREDGRIYIVDANNTPYGPPNQIGEEEGELAVDLSARAFFVEFIARTRNAPPSCTPTMTQCSTVKTDCPFLN